MKYRDAQLENYTPDLTFSASDYHHVKEPTLTRTYSTCHFPQPKSKSHGRQASRFTVISNVADTEHSYDPFKASRPQHLNAMRPANYAKVTIHRRGPSAEENKDSLGDMKGLARTSALVAAGSERGRQQKLVAPRIIASRSSLASSTRSKSSNPLIRAPVGHKRGVSFSHIQRRSTSSQRKADGKSAVNDRHSNHTEVTDNGGDSLYPVDGTSTGYIRSKKAQAVVPQPLLPASRPGHGSQLWTEDVRQLSSSLAMDCDEAFNRTSVIPDIAAKEKDPLQPSSIDRKSSPLATQPPVNAKKSKLASFNNRPLPPPPARSDSVKIELLEARNQAELRKTLDGDEPPGYLDRMVSHIDRLMLPSSPERRTSSAPAEGKYKALGQRLPSIYEAGKEEESPRRQTDFDKYLESQHGVKTSRIASAPEPRETKKRYLDNQFMRSESGIRDTIRIVDSSYPSPVKVPAPLTIRKKSSQGGPSNPTADIFSPDDGRSSSRVMVPGLELRQQYRTGSRSDLGRINEDYSYDDQFGNGRNTGTIIKKKPTWFKKNSKPDDGDFRMSVKAADTTPSQSSSNDIVAGQYLNPPLPILSKKRGFSLGRLFKKRSSQPNMTIGGEYLQPAGVTRKLTLVR